MNAKRARALRSDDRPHPGRKHGGGTKIPSSGTEDRRSANKFLGTQPETIEDRRIARAGA